MSTEGIRTFGAVQGGIPGLLTDTEVMASIATGLITTIPTGPFIGAPSGIPGVTS